jgi:hypothetical protein
MPWWQIALIVLGAALFVFLAARALLKRRKQRLLDTEQERYEVRLAEARRQHTARREAEIAENWRAQAAAAAAAGRAAQGA